MPVTLYNCDRVVVVVGGCAVAVAIPVPPLPTTARTSGVVCGGKLNPICVYGSELINPLVTAKCLQMEINKIIETESKMVIGIFVCCVS